MYEKLKEFIKKHKLEKTVKVAGTIAVIWVIVVFVAFVTVWNKIDRKFDDGVREFKSNIDKNWNTPQKQPEPELKKIAEPKEALPSPEERKRRRMEKYKKLEALSPLQGLTRNERNLFIEGFTYVVKCSAYVDSLATTYEVGIERMNEKQLGGCSSKEVTSMLGYLRTLEYKMLDTKAMYFLSDLGELTDVTYNFVGESLVGEMLNKAGVIFKQESKEKGDE